MRCKKMGMVLIVRTTGVESDGEVECSDEWVAEDGRGW